MRSLGTSNMAARKLTALIKTATIKPVDNQIESHPFLAQTQEHKWAAKHGIVLIAYSPLGSPDRPPRLIEDADPAPLHDASVLAFAAKHGKDTAQILIRWEVQCGFVCTPKSTTPVSLRLILMFSLLSSTRKTSRCSLSLMARRNALSRYEESAPQVASRLDNGWPCQLTKNIFITFCICIPLTFSKLLCWHHCTGLSGSGNCHHVIHLKIVVVVVVG